MPRITFLPAGSIVIASEGESIFDAGRRAGVGIPTACVGRATCGLCRVKVLSGEQNLSPMIEAERKHLGNTYFITRLRLACQAKLVGGDVSVRIPDGRPGERVK